jgi:regulator of cell morphogenesis and NO signaling
MTSCDLDTSVPDWLIDHPETLAVFQELGIDYACGGKSLAFACREREHDPPNVLEKLRCLFAGGKKGTGPFNTAQMDLSPFFLRLEIRKLPDHATKSRVESAASRRASIWKDNPD